MATKNCVAVDLGAESGRTVVARFDGTLIELSETYRFVNQPVRVLGSLHWDVLRLWHDIKTGLTKSAAEAGAPACIGVDTWGVDFGLLDANGRLLANPYHYRDKRTDGIFDRAFHRVPKAEIYQTTGLQFLQFNSLFQLFAMSEQGPDAFAGARGLLFIPDLLNYFLTGVQAAEFTIASTSQMLNARTHQWADDLLNRLAIPKEILPNLLPTGSRLGPLLGDVARETGCGSASVVATAGHDTAAAVAAVPAVGEDWCYISSGTWSLMGVELPHSVVTERSLADNFTNEGGVGGAVRFLKNIMGLWLVQECRRSLERAGRSHDYSELVDLAEKAAPFGPIVNPNSDAFLKPDDMPVAIAQACRRAGQSPPTDVGALIRCCLESLALCYRQTLESIEANIGRSIRVVHIVGGGCKNELLCQLTADCCQREVIAGPVEATALGNALVQLRGVGEVRSLAEAREIVRNSFPVKSFRPKSVAGWNEAYDRFRTFAETGG